LLSDINKHTKPEVHVAAH